MQRLGRNFSVSSASPHHRLPASLSRQVVRTAPRLERLSRTRKKLKFVRGTPPQVVSPSLSSHVADHLLPSPLRVASSSRPRRKSNPPLSPPPTLARNREGISRRKINRPIRLRARYLSLSIYLSICLSLVHRSLHLPFEQTRKNSRLVFTFRCDRRRVKMKREREKYLCNSLFKIKIETDF